MKLEINYKKKMENSQMCVMKPHALKQPIGQRKKSIEKFKNILRLLKMETQYTKTQGMQQKQF